MNYFLEILRYQLFWLLDFIKGSHVKQHLNDIKKILESENSTANNHLIELLRHAATTTPFYKNIEYHKGLSAFPIINKNTINTNPKKFLSSHFKKHQTKKVITSGSTGASLQVVQDKNKQYRNTADTIYFSNLAGFKIGYKLFYLRHWFNGFKKNQFMAWLQNIKTIEVLELSDNNIDKLISHLKKDSSRKGLLGYADSGFGEICNYLDETHPKPMDLGLKSIIGMSECLSDKTRQKLSYYFKTPVVSRYSNMENGILAQQKTNGIKDFTINWASYHIEILNINNDNPARPNQCGRIVVTDLFNKAMPIIRYDTGDLGIMDLHAIPPVLKEISGRKSDTIYNTHGSPISPLIIINMNTFKGIRQLQLIQLDKIEYTLKLNVSKAFNHKKEILSRFKECLGQDAQIKLEFVNEIPVLKSGKRKITVNRYKNTD